MSSAEPSCHPTYTNTDSVMTVPSASINQVGSFKLMDDRSDSVFVDARNFSDKVPLTELHFCRNEDCHSGKQKPPADGESPLDPIKTRSLFTLLTLIALWLLLYIILTYFKVW